jgi:hypothetical protein
VRKEDRDCIFAYAVILKLPKLQTKADRLQYVQEFLKSEGISVASREDIIIYEQTAFIYVSITGKQAMKSLRDQRVRFKMLKVKHSFAN